MSSGKIVLLRPRRGSREAIVHTYEGGGGDGSSVSLFSMVQVGDEPAATHLRVTTRWPRDGVRVFAGLWRWHLVGIPSYCIALFSADMLSTTVGVLRSSTRQDFAAVT